MKLILKLAAPAMAAFMFGCGGAADQQGFGENDQAIDGPVSLQDYIDGYCAPLGVAGSGVVGSGTYHLVLGTNGDDNLTAMKTDGVDCILGMGGNDIIRGGKGNDVLVGGDGDDDINGEAGDDVIFGGDGNDSLNGGDGNDLVRGQKGNDFVTGDVGNDVIDGNQGDDHLLGEGGNDTVYGDAEDVTFKTSGGAGMDTCRAGAAGYLTGSNACEHIIP